LKQASKRRANILFVDRIVQWFLPRENRFFTYLNSIAKHVSEGADIFAALRDAKDRADFSKIADALHQTEHDADEIAHVLYEELDKTFVTPIDREDLHHITGALDDVLDIMEACSSQIVLYKLEKLTDPMKELIGKARDASHEVSQCIALLQDLSKLEKIQLHVIKVNSLENEGDRIYRRAMAQLFENTIDPVELIREKEILDSLEECVDACEDVMDIIRSVVVKNG
jgi:predicted phosphate transport protein (TIGR00153 family)